MNRLIHAPAYPLVAALIASVVACGVSPVEPEASNTAFTSHLDIDVPELMTRYGVPGVAVALIENGNPVWSAGYGYADVQARTPMTEDTICRAESISKAVTAWGVMRLVEQQRLDPGEPVETYLDEWELPESSYREADVTVAHLLSHLSGFPLGTIGPPTEYAPGGPTPPFQEFVLSEASLVQEPGTGFIYSDVGFNLLQLVVEEVTGEAFDSYMRREVLVPLGMTDSDYEWRASYAPRIATGYEIDGTAVGPYVYPAAASGGLLADVDDIARFVAAGMLPSEGQRSKVLSTATLREMYAPRAEIPGIYGFVADAYGYGHFLETLPDGRRAVWHGGQGHGWMTHFHSIPESGDGIVLLTNSQRSWPFIAAVLSSWAHWTGAERVSFGIIRPATVAFWGVIAAVGIAAVLQGCRLVRGVLAGVRKWEPLPRARRLLRVVQLVSGVALVAFVVRRVSLPYVDEAAIFPAAAPWAALAFFALGAILIASALVPRVHRA